MQRDKRQKANTPETAEKKRETKVNEEKIKF